MNNTECNKCPISDGTHKPAEAVHQIHEPTDQPEALRYADAICAGLSYTSPHILALAADELRAQHARIAELEKAESDLINQRDHCEEIINRMADAVLGKDRPEWSSVYDFMDAAQEVEDRVAELEAQLAAAPQAVQAATESVLIDGVAYEVHAEVAAELLRLHIELQQASSQSGEQEERRVCNNEECGWIGPLSETYGYKHSPATLCPECKETTELAAPAHPADGVPAQDEAFGAGVDACIDKLNELNHQLPWSLKQSEALSEAIAALEALATTHPTQQGLDALNQAIEAMQLALSSHGIQLLSYPPQDAWSSRRVDEKLRTAISALAAQAKQGGAYHG